MINQRRKRSAREITGQSRYPPVRHHRSLHPLPSYERFPYRTSASVPRLPVEVNDGKVGEVVEKVVSVDDELVGELDAAAAAPDPTAADAVDTGLDEGFGT